jgi:hypothetical protein
MKSHFSRTVERIATTQAAQFFRRTILKLLYILNTEKKLLTMSSGKGEQSGKSGVIWINKEKGSEPVGIVMIENSPVSPIRVLLHPKQDGKIHR